MSDTPISVILRMIASSAYSAAVLARLSILCKEQGMTYTVTQDETYWKIPDKREMTVHLCTCPTWNYGQWSKVYHDLFKQGFTLEWEADDAIHLFTYPPTDSDAPWTELFIPSPCFWPKPSKDIKY